MSLFASARLVVCLLAIVPLVPMAGFSAGEESDGIRSEDFTYASTFDGTNPLYARVVYSESGGPKPVMLLMHGYACNRHHMEYSARRMARRGYFSVCLQTRGWGGPYRWPGGKTAETELSAGEHDDGGIETWDVHDGLMAALAKYPGQTDPERVSIYGGSYGGGMVYFASVRFPYLFRGAMACFGIPDYRRHLELRLAAGLGNRGTLLRQAIGALPEENPDLYMARSATLASGNLSGTRFHIVHDEEETICPLPMVREFIAALEARGYSHLFVHESKKTDAQRWHHGLNSDDNPVAAKNNVLSPVEDLFMDDLEHATKPVMPEIGELTVIGYLITPRFTCVVGTGNDSAARVGFDFREPSRLSLSFTPLTSNPSAPMRVTLPLEILPAGTHRVSVDGGPPRDFEQRAGAEIHATISSRMVVNP